MAVTTGASGTASHSAVISADTPTSSGAVVSMTVSICVADLLLPHASVQMGGVQQADRLTDRAHNVLLDSLVMGGLLGVLGRAFRMPTAMLSVFFVAPPGQRRHEELAAIAEDHLVEILRALDLSLPKTLCRSGESRPG